ncbi:phosphate acetyltransferase [Bermanella marisrubri]|uniref:Phosphate acetyltransferase n=1 Tax=Bermanella marisrubri TaxID=207949 RepID=Q1N184_9GAMM|nr:phosphate acetyltransferase [Bermanella marisrubri]EAT11967.1 phosphate acetyltransferase [Oceanobacter sp. RED65] [Bermanella marisrubri]QIZ84771.1 phosphate acetyltransferase [Bermanella marisrubri]
MQHTFFIAPTEMKTGLTSITLGLMRALDQLGVKVAACKPISREQYDNTHRSIELIAAASGKQPPTPISLPEAQKMMSDKKHDRLMEEVVAMHHKIAKDVDVVIVEGVEPDRNEPYALRLNVEMAKTLDAEVILVAAPNDRDQKALASHVDMAKNLYGGDKNQKLLGIILNKINAPANRSIPIKTQEGPEPTPLSLDELKASYKSLETDHFKLLGLIPWDSDLVAPRTKDIANYLQADVISAANMEDARVKRISLCARTVPNMITALQPGALIVTPGDREDILLAAAMAAQNGMPLAGLLFTSDLDPDERVMGLIAPALAHMPVLKVSTDTFTTATQLASMDDGVKASDPQRMNAIMTHMAEHLDSEYLAARLEVDHHVRLSPAAFRYQLVQLASQANKRIVLPEGDEPRTIQAAAMCQQRGIARCVLLGNPERIQQVAASLGVTLPEDLEILDPEAIRERYIDPMVELRKHKNLTAPMAEAQLEDNVVLGTMMLALDEVDGLVSGAVHTTANTIRPALQIVKTAPDAKLVSSVFFMLLPEQVMVYGDCAVNPDPNASELADIALQSAQSAEAFGIAPKVAMISYSTGSSGSGSDVEKVREATSIAQKNRPDLLIDGPLQYDAATTASVAASKAPDSKVAGQASVVIFPDLNTGNTTYKAVQRSANVVSIGPMLQGLAKPVNDLSRGALVEDIIYTIALTAIQAANQAKAK